MLDQKKRTLKRLGIAGVATAMTTMGIPGIAGAATLRVPDATASNVSAPGAPTALKATDAGLDQITLSWTAPSGTVSGYNIYEGSASGAESATPVNHNVLVTGTTDTVKVANSGTFYFEVAAVNAAGIGAKSAEADAVAAAVVPGAPGSVAAVAADGAVQVSWSAPSTGGTPTSYTINYGTSSSSLTSQKLASGSATSTVVSGLTNGTEYYFDVVATNGAGSGTASSTVSATPSTSTAPLPPTLSISGTSSGQIDLSWTTSTNATGYNVYEGTSAGAESSTPINGSVPVTGTSLTVSATNGTTEYFVVKAVNSTGSSAASNEVHATAGVTAATAAPTAPQSLAATVVGPTDVKLTWSAPASSGSSGIKEYEIKYTDSAGTAVSPKVSGTSDTLTSVGTTASTTFTVIAQNTASYNQSPPIFDGVAATVKAKPTSTSPVVPGTPTITSVSTGKTSTSVLENTIKWTAASYPTAGTNTKYLIKRDGTPIGSTTGTSFTDSGTGFASDSAPASGTTYSYQVTEVSGTTTGGTSSVAKIDTAAAAPAAPTSLVATVPSNGNVNLVWDVPVDQGAGNLTYKVLENGSATSNATLHTPASGKDTATVTGVSSTTSTTFTVEAESQSASTDGVVIGTSGPSNAVAVMAVMPASAPAAPTGLTAAAVSSTSVKLQWNASSTDGYVAPSNYEVLWNTTGKTAADFSTGSSHGSAEIDTSTSYTATSLNPGTTYYFEVEALKSPTGTPVVDTNTASATTTTSVVSTAPGAPTGLKATVDGGLVDLSWTAPSSSGGSKISGYEIFSSSSSTFNSSTAKPLGSTSGTGTTAVLDNVGTSKVDLFVEAKNSSGQTSSASAPVAVTPASFSQRPSAPGTPQVQAEAGGKAFVLWTAPSTTGGTLTGYFVTAHLVNGKGKTIFVKGANTTSATVSGLMTGSYYFTVVAVNSIGGGTPSGPSNFVHVSSAVSATKVYVTPPAMLNAPGMAMIRVTVNMPTARVQLFDEAYGKNFFFSKAIKETTPSKYGNGVAEFMVHIDATNSFYVMVNGVKSNVVTAMVK